MRGAILEALTWPEARSWFKRDPVLLVPIGAISKEHGPHLPLNTDWCVARALAARVAEQLPVLVAPVIGFGYYPVFTRFPGSQHLQADTFIALLKDLLGGYIDQGLQNIAILNTGVSTEAPLRIAVRDIMEQTGVRIATADIRTLSAGSGVALQQKMGGHADEGETSVMLALAPDAVKLEHAETDYGHALTTPESVFHRPIKFNLSPDSGRDYTGSGAFGDPTLATREKGEAIVNAMTTALIAGLKVEFPENVKD